MNSKDNFKYCDKFSMILSMIYQKMKISLNFTNFLVKNIIVLLF